jgi:methionyl aminopeptidase
MIRLKTEREIGKIRESCRILAEVMEKIVAAVAPGVTTKDLDAYARELIKARGAKPAFLGYMGYGAALCTSVGSEVIHGIPGKRTLQDGEIISLDLGLDYHGYFSDQAVTVPVGSVSEEVRQLMKVTEECLYLAIEQAKSGNRMNDISRAVWNHATAHGYGVVHEYCGHGVGFSQHEDPQVPNYIGRGPNPRLKPGMVLAIEPMINLGTGDVDLLDDGWTVVTGDGKLSAHFEHTVALFEDRTEILTKLD